MKQSEYKALWEKFEEVLAAARDEKAPYMKQLFDAVASVMPWEDRFALISPKLLQLCIDRFGNPQSEAAQMSDEDFGFLLRDARKEKPEPVETD